MNLRLLCVTMTSIKSDIYSELLNNNTISIGTIFLDYFLQIAQVKRTAHNSPYNSLNTSVIEVFLQGVI